MLVTFRISEQDVKLFRLLSKEYHLTNSDLFGYMLDLFVQSIDKLTAEQIKYKYSTKCNKNQ